MNHKRPKVNGLRVNEATWELLKNVLGPNTFLVLTAKAHKNLNKWEREGEVFDVEIYFKSKQRRGLISWSDTKKIS